MHVTFIGSLIKLLSATAYWLFKNNAEIVKVFWLVKIHYWNNISLLIGK